jgi:hypothetical protein
VFNAHPSFEEFEAATVAELGIGDHESDGLFGEEEEESATTSYAVNAAMEILGTSAVTTADLLGPPQDEPKVSHVPSKKNAPTKPKATVKAKAPTKTRAPRKTKGSKVPKKKEQTKGVPYAIRQRKERFLKLSEESQKSIFKKCSATKITTANMISLAATLVSLGVEFEPVTFEKAPTPVETLAFTYAAQHKLGIFAGDASVEPELDPFGDDLSEH